MFSDIFKIGNDNRNLNEYIMYQGVDPGFA